MADTLADGAAHTSGMKQGSSTGLRATCNALLPHQVGSKPTAVSEHPSLRDAKLEENAVPKAETRLYVEGKGRVKTPRWLLTKMPRPTPRAAPKHGAREAARVF